MCVFCVLYVLNSERIGKSTKKSFMIYENTQKGGKLLFFNALDYKN